MHFGGMTLEGHTCDIDIDVGDLYRPYTSCKLIRLASPIRAFLHVRNCRTSRSFADPTMSLSSWHEDRVMPRHCGRAGRRHEHLSTFGLSRFRSRDREASNHPQQCKQHDQHNSFVRACCREKLRLRDNLASGITFHPSSLIANCAQH